MRLIPRLRIAQKLPLIVIGAALVVGSAVGAASYYVASQALETQAKQNLATIAFERANQLSMYLTTLQENVKQLARSETAIQALNELGSAYRLILDADPATVLHRAFIDDNPNAPAERLLLDMPAEQTSYGYSHGRFQPMFREQLKANGLADIYLFDVKGSLVYSTAKAEDFATRFADDGSGPFSATQLGDLYRRTRDLPTGSIEFADFGRYAALGTTPVAFFATPTANAKGDPIGVLAVALTADRLSTVIGYRVGLGKTGDTVVVGLDGLSRSDTHLTDEDDVLQPTLFDPVISEAVTGVPGETTGEIRGRTVIAAAAPVDVTHNKSWGLLATMEVEEITAPIRQLGMTILTIGVPMLLAVAVFGALFSRSLTKPIGRLTAAMKALAGGDLDVEVRGANRHDEIGDMARAVEVFRQNGIRVLELTEDERLNEEARREERADMMRALQRSFGQVVDAAVAGDFSARITESFADPELNALAQSINNLVGTVDRGVADTGRVLAAMAHADLRLRMDGSYHGALGQLANDTNAVGERLGAIVFDLLNASRTLKAATGEMMAGANDLSERTTRQAATIEETSAAMEQLAATVADNARRAEQASAKARAVADAATQGGTVMQRANEAMERITTSSSKISSIIRLIDDIAFQTNLLALNASVEAARAGESGKGFAVVAVEVRRLAQSAAQASAEVKALIEQSTGEVGGGTKLVADAAARLVAMLEAAEENSALIEGIARASRDQATAIDGVSRAVRELDEMTRHNAALVEETNNAIGQAEAQANELDRIVEVFEVDGDRPRHVRVVA